MSSGLTRRRFLAASLTAAGGLLLSFRLPALGRAPASVEVDGEGAEINAWLAIEADGGGGAGVVQRSPRRRVVCRCGAPLAPRSSGHCPMNFSCQAVHASMTAPSSDLSTLI